MSWWSRRSSRNARPQTPPGPEGSNGSGGRVCRDVAVGAASICAPCFSSSSFSFPLSGSFSGFPDCERTFVGRSSWPRWRSTLSCGFRLIRTKMADYSNKREHHDDAASTPFRGLGSMLMAGVAQADTVTLGITQIVEHPALDASRQGALDELAERGYVEGDNLRVSFENAQGDTSIAAQIARKFAGDRPDLVLAISTPSSQSAAAAMSDIPIVFTAVTDPLLARLVSDLEAPGGNITGVVDAPPLEAQLQLIRDMLPEARRLGVLYNPGEANSVSQAEKLEALAPELDFQLVEVTASRTSEVMGAARSLAGRVDVIYVPVDNTVVSALESVLRVGYDADIPVFTGDTSSVERGALASLGFSYYDMGRQTGGLIARILEGEDPGDIPVGSVENLELVLNRGAAARFGYEIPDTFLEQAVEIID